MLEMSPQGQGGEERNNVEVAVMRVQSNIQHHDRTGSGRGCIWEGEARTRR